MAPLCVRTTGSSVQGKGGRLSTWLLRNASYISTNRPTRGQGVTPSFFHESTRSTPIPPLYLYLFEAGLSSGYVRPASKRTNEREKLCGDVILTEQSTLRKKAFEESPFHLLPRLVRASSPSRFPSLSPISLPQWTTPRDWAKGFSTSYLGCSPPFCPLRSAAQQRSGTCTCGR